jgi:IS5 family transposase
MKQGYNTNFFDDYVWNNFIPKDNYLVKIKDFVNLDFLKPLVKNSYKNQHPAGRDPVDPRTMFMIGILQFLEHLSDDRAEEKLYEVPLYRWFVDLCPTDKVPDATTISFFRRERMGEKKFKAAFDQVIKQLYDAGLIDGRVQAQDATDIRGDIAVLTAFQLLNKCRRKLLSAVEKINPNKYEQLLKKYDFQLLRNPPNRQKHFEDLLEATHGLVAAIQRSGKLRKDKNIQKELELTEMVLEQREDEYFDEEGKKQRRKDMDRITGKIINTSDPDVNWGAKSDKKFFAGYKTEVNTDLKYGIITEIEVNKAGHSEEKSAAPLLERQKENLGIVPEHFSADAKYDYGNTRTELRAIGVPNIYIPLVPTKNKEGGFTLDDFFFEMGHLFCPAGYPAEYMFSDDRKMSFEFKFNAAVCNACELRSECTKAKYGRRVLVSHTQLERRAAISFNASEVYNIMYKEQHWKVEPQNADLKRYRGLKRARYRGLSRVRIQAYLAALACNLRKYVKFITGKLKDGILETLSKMAALAPPTGVVCLDTS